MSSLYNLNRQKDGTTSVTDGCAGFSALTEQLERYIKGAENSTEILMDGATEFLKDLNKLTKPTSRIRKSGYTHLIDSFAIDSNKKEVIVGWGKYHGRMVELGTQKMDARAHMYPLWDHNKEKYYKLMLTKLGMKTW
ncbi:MAG: hypothetical protein J6A89_04140 [Clostridia bacterium]|nr:hypothetical protein [Clostridia bacterium]